MHGDRRAVLATTQTNDPRNISRLDEQGPEVDHASAFFSRVLMIAEKNVV
jgi:hypothetical protein